MYLVFSDDTLYNTLSYLNCEGSGNRYVYCRTLLRDYFMLYSAAKSQLIL